MVSLIEQQILANRDAPGKEKKKPKKEKLPAKK